MAIPLRTKPSGLRIYLLLLSVLSGLVAFFWLVIFLQNFPHPGPLVFMLMNVCPAIAIPTFYAVLERRANGKPPAWMKVTYVMLATLLFYQMGPKPIIDNFLGISVGDDRRYYYNLLTSKCDLLSPAESQLYHLEYLGIPPYGKRLCPAYSGLQLPRPYPGK